MLSYALNYDATICLGNHPIPTREVPLAPIPPMPHGSRPMRKRTYQILTAAAAGSGDDPGRVVLGRRCLPLLSPSGAASSAAAAALLRDGGGGFHRPAAARGEVRRAPELRSDRRGRVHGGGGWRRSNSRGGSRVSEVRAKGRDGGD